MSLLQGVIDLHVHVGPDVRPRKVDALELARAARSAGMRGLVLKNHHTSTVQSAAVVRAVVPELAVCGGIALNEAVGGLNPAAVDAALTMGGKIVWMPTHDSAHERAFHGRPGGINTLDERGRLREPVEEILRLVAEREAVVALGHVSPEEMLALVRAARAAGVSRIVVNHPEIRFLALTHEQQRELAGPGVFFERCYVRPLQFCTTWDGLAASIRQLGPDSTVLGTDLGQIDSPDPVPGMEEMLRELSQRGITDREMDRIARENPAHLLGLAS
jgi:predicted TIM-barrel fold metal-dependent hydrolase